MINIISKVKWFFKKEWKKYLLMFLMLVLISAIALTPTYILGRAIDTIISGQLTPKLLAIYGILLIGMPLVRYTLSYFYNVLASKQAQKLGFELRHRYLEHLFKMDNKFFEKYTKGDLISRVTSDLDNLTSAATSLLEGIVFNGSMIVFAITIMASTISWKLTLISVLIMPIGLTILNYVRFQKRKYIQHHQEIYATMTEKILESVEGQKTIRAYGQEENDLKKQYKTIDDDIKSWRYIVNYENWFNPLFEVIYGISYFLAFSFGSYFIINQEITLGQLVSFVSYIGMLYGPIIAISSIFQQLNNATVAADRIEEIMSSTAEVVDYVDAQPIINFKTIEFKHVTFKYPFDKEPVLKDINLVINVGETIGIVGQTGSGKSTLIRQLLREFNTSSGTILIDGTSIDHYKIEDVRNLVGYVPQVHMLFKRSVDDNILMGNPKATYQELNKAVQIADFEKDILYLHDGHKTMVEEAGASLSGGQRQRLSIARAVIKDPQILILDDSLSAVDAKTEDNIIGQLKVARSGKTNIIIAHRFSAVREANIIYVLEHGEITARGTHEDLLRMDGWYKRQYIEQISMGDK